MYEKRFGLHRKPFQSVLSDHDFYQSETFRAILPGMLNALRSDLGVAVLTGPQGVGKSVTLEAVRRKLAGDCQAILIRGGTVKSAADLLFLLHRSLLKCQVADGDATTTPSDTVRRWEVVERLQRVAEFWGPLVVLLDDAHLVKAEVFAELRALLEEEVAGQKLVRLLITGPLLLEEVLAEPGHADFAQKIRTHVFLQPLSSVEAVEFLSHNISNAGGELSVVMQNSAIERIVAAADGIPRCLNLLADESLIVCEESNISHATRVSVDTALKRLQHLPYAWNVSLYDDSADEDCVDAFGMPAADTYTAITKSDLHSVVEIGGVSEPPANTTTESSHGVIEIGGSSPPSQPETASVAAVTPSVHGVIEIGAPAVSCTQQNDVADAAIDAVAVESELTEAVADEVILPADCMTATDQWDDGGAEIFSAVEIDAETFFANADDDIDSPEAIEAEVEAEIEIDGEIEANRDGSESYENEDKLAALLARVSFKNGNSAVKKSATEEPAAFDSKPAEVSLEHHLLLAGRDSSDDESEDHNDDSGEATVADDVVVPLDFVEVEFAGQESTVQEFVGQDTDLSSAVDVNRTDDAVVELDDAQDARTESHAETADVALSGYAPWQPAGEWPISGSSTRPMQPTPEPEPEPVAATRATAIQPQHPDAKPVFDRYTWCELGRSVTPIQRNRLDLATMPSLAIWPPITDGIAPVDNIPVETIHEDYAELLMDLGMLVNAASEGAAPLSDVRSERLEGTVAAFLDSTTHHPPVLHTPDAAIEEIQNLIDIDQDTYSEGHLESDSAHDESAAEEPTHDSATNAAELDAAPDWIAGQLIVGEGFCDIDPPWPVVPIDDEVAQGDEDAVDDDWDGTPDPLAIDPGQDSSGTSEAEFFDPETRDSNAVQDEEQLVCEDRSVGDFVAEDEEQLYVPRLMQQARRRVAGQSVRSGRLRFAAGAEGYNVLPASPTKPADKPTEIRLAHAEISDITEQADTPEPEAEGGRFLNLFTRLRKLRKTSN